MNGPINENDLLGFIEGDLPSGRMLEIERAVRADAGLASTLEAMRRDRVLLRAEFARMFVEAGGRAPHRTVQEALEAAEREAILAGAGEARRATVLARLGPGLAMAASLALLLVGGTVVWNAMAPSKTVRQIGGEQAAGVSGAMESVLALEPRTSAGLPGVASTVAEAGAQSETQAMLVADAGPTREERIDRAIELSTLADAERRDLRASLANLATPAGFVPRATSWTELHAHAPVLPTRSPSSLTGGLPLAEIVEALDKAGIDWRKFDEQVLTLAVAGRERAMTRPAARDIPEATPSSYEDALRLAALNRLSLRVVADDPLAVERELFRLAEEHGMIVSLQNRGDACGAAAYSVEMPRTEGDLAMLVDAVCGPCRSSAARGHAPSRQTFFDVSLLPVAAAGQRGSLTTPVQITDGSPRVSVPVLIERAGGR